MFMLRPDGDSNEAADTGSATHEAVHTWHQTKDAAAAIDSMRVNLNRYPRADLNEAAAMFLHYSQDQRNIEARVEASERKISFGIEAAPDDPTGRPIIIVGTLDQVRRVDGVLKLYDVKTSKKPGWVLMQSHMWQIMAYCVGATRVLGEPVHPGALIRPRAYPSQAGVYFNYAISLADCLAAMDGFRYMVSAIRAGRPLPSPGEWCEWCHLKTFDECVPRYTNFINIETGLLNK